LTLPHSNNIMRSDRNSITFPLLDVPWMAVATGILLSFYGVLILFLGIRDMITYNFRYSFILIAGFAFILLWLGLKCLVKSQVRVHLVSEGIALSLFGKTFRTYPAQELKLCCFVDKGTYQESNVFLCVSCHSLETLALLWEQSCRKNPVTRHDLPFLKRKSDWQQSFARSFLRKHSSLFPWTIPEKGIFYMVTTRERESLIAQMYPQLPREDLTRLPEHYYLKPPEPNGMKPRVPETPEHFLQCQRHAEDLPIVAMAFVFCPSCFLLFFAIGFLDGTAGLLLSALSVAWLFGSLFSLIPLWNKWVSIQEDGLHLQFGKREIRHLPVSEIRTIYCFDYKVKNGVCRYMAVSSLAPEEIIEREEAYMARSHRKQECLSAYTLADSWPHAAQCRYLARRMLLFGLYDREFFILAHEPEREAWLKSRYPHVSWIETSGIANLNQFYPNLS